MGKVLRVGLTGGSGTGKTTVAAFLGDLGATVIDADEIARRLLQPGTDAYREIVKAFGTTILLREGGIDRRRLSRIIFTDPGRRETLEAVLHPRILEEEDRRIEELQRGPGTGVTVTDAALLVETGAFRRYDRLVVVFCREETQLKRLTQGLGLTRPEAVSRLRCQLPNQEKIQVADFTVDTDRSLEETRREVRRLFGVLTRILEEGGVSGPGRSA